MRTSEREKGLYMETIARESKLKFPCDIATSFVIVTENRHDQFNICGSEHHAL